MTNSITLVGRAARDPEVRYFESGNMVAKLTLAVSRSSRGDDPDLFNLEIWGKQAQIAADYIRKGHLIGIIGGLRLGRWADRASGEERTTPVILVDRLELLDMDAERRPDPPSLKEQALELVRRIEGAESAWALSELSVIVRALEALTE